MLLKAHRMHQIARKMAQLEASLAGASGELHELREELEATAAATGVELETIRRLDADTLTEALAPGGGPAPGRLWAAAEVLYLDGLATLGEGRTDTAQRRLGKARHLYTELDDGFELPEEAVPLEERLERIDGLLEGGG